MKVSVIVPTYRPGQYLWECLHSLKVQTLSKSEYEIILVLNGEINPYDEEIIKYIATEMTSVNMVYKISDEKGVSRARNIGIDSANGEYITFVDDDDIVSENYLSGLLEKASRDTIAISYTESFTDTISQSNKDYVLTKEFLDKSPKGKMPFQKAAKFFQGPCMKLFKREIIDGNRYDPRLKNGEDSLFMFLISDKMKFVEFTDTSSMYYRRIRQDGANYSKKTYGYKIKNSYYLIKQYTSIYFQNVSDYSLGFFLTRVFGAVKSCIFY